MTENELLEELRKTITAEETRPDGFCTSMELSEASGKSPSSIRVLLRKLFVRGEIEVQTIRQVAMDGRQARIPVYRLKSRAA